ncbi:MAG: large-conductance mechanosensitive channel protein MscL [Muribaculaceae bacterium]
MGKFIQDFKEFAMRGNVIDMAVGVIIGGAFGKIVTSLVNDVIMPAISLFTGDVNFTNLKWTLRDAVVNEAGETVSEAVSLQYGMFIQNIVDFLIIALCIFVAIRMLSKLKKKEEEAPAAPAPEPAPSAEEKLLTEIRDLLKEKK